MSIPQLRTYTTPGDIEHIQKLGFDHIRIPVGPELFLRCGGSWDNCEPIQILDQVVQKALSLNLAVIIDFHPDQQYARQLATNEQADENFLRLWAQIAEHFSRTDSDRVFLEVLNEFSNNDPYRWSGLLQEAVRVIRRHAPTSTIIVSGGTYADIWDLVKLPQIVDSNVIYNFHYYEPHLFTHQGATWGTPVWRDISNLPFPANSSAITELMEKQESPSAQWDILQYSESHWDASRIEADIQFAARWAKNRNVPLICNEFGVYRNLAPPEDRERWISATRIALEKSHIGWTAWDYQGGFGIVYKDTNGLRDDDVALRGLGLRK